MENQNNNIELIITELRNENKKAFELINANQISIKNQNYVISNLENRNDSLSEELECVKREISICGKQEKHMNSILDIAETLSQSNQTLNTNYASLKSIKKKFDKSIQKQQNVNSNETTSKKRQKESDSMSGIKNNRNRVNENGNENNNLIENGTTEEISNTSISIKMEKQDQIKEETTINEYLPKSSFDVENNYPSMDTIKKISPYVPESLHAHMI
jgi:hypothetical protein